jgi:lipoprotein-anchoring transpeptidase ErfK/SrfK
MFRSFPTLSLLAAAAVAICAAPANAEATGWINPATFGQLDNQSYASPIRRQEVSYETAHTPGTIVVDTKERRLYLVLGNGRALRYGVGVGKPGFEWGGVQHVSMKREWPDWRPPEQMLRRRPDLPRYMPGGEDNPLGARALYLGSTLYRIHGSNEPETIGDAVSSGCIRMTNDDVIDLYERVRVGARVVVMR